MQLLIAATPTSTSFLRRGSSKSGRTTLNGRPVFLSRAEIGLHRNLKRRRHELLAAQSPQPLARRPRPKPATPWPRSFPTHSAVSPPEPFDRSGRCKFTPTGKIRHFCVSATPLAGFPSGLPNCRSRWRSAASSWNLSLARAPITARWLSSSCRRCRLRESTKASGDPCPSHSTNRGSTPASLQACRWLRPSRRIEIIPCQASGAVQHGKGCWRRFGAEPCQASCG